MTRRKGNQTMVHVHMLGKRHNSITETTKSRIEALYVRVFTANCKKILFLQIPRPDQTKPIILGR